MAVTRAELQVTWSASNSLSVSASGNGTSDAMAFNAATAEAMAHLKADNNGTPAAGSTVDFYIEYTGGDPDGAGSDEYDTAGHARYLATVDTNIEDPAIVSIPISAAAKGFKIYAVNNDTTNAITVSCCVTELRA